MTVGYWLSRNGDIRLTPDHFGTVLDFPELFGFTRAESKLWSPNDRQDVLTKAVEVGWIRVLGNRPHLNFQFWLLDNRTIFAITNFLSEKKIDPCEQSLFEELKTDATWYKPNSWILGGEALAAARNPRKRG